MRSPQKHPFRPAHGRWTGVDAAAVLVCASMFAALRAEDFAAGGLALAALLILFRASGALGGDR